MPRLGRKNRMGAKQRERIWPIFADVKAKLAARGLAGDLPSAGDLYGARMKALRSCRDRQGHLEDLGVSRLRFLAAISSRARMPSSSPVILGSASSSSPSPGSRWALMSTRTLAGR